MARAVSPGRHLLRGPRLHTRNGEMIYSSGGDMAAVTTRIIAARFCCGVCGAEVRIPSECVEDLNRAAYAWIAEHNEPRLLAVEEETDRVEYEWVPVP